MHTANHPHQQNNPRALRARLTMSASIPKTASGKNSPRRAASGKTVLCKAAPRLRLRRFAQNIVSDCLVANNRQLHPDERKWARDNADKFAQFYKEKTGDTINAAQAEKMLLGDGYRMVDASASKGDGVAGSPMNDAVATQFISAVV